MTITINGLLFTKATKLTGSPNSPTMGGTFIPTNQTMGAAQ